MRGRRAQRQPPVIVRSDGASHTAHELGRCELVRLTLAFVALGIFLVVLPLVGVSVSSKAELIGGNCTNVTSDVGACIAAGLMVHLVRRDRRRSEEFHEFVQRVHARHDGFEKAIDEAVAASRRAEKAATPS